VNSTLNRAIVLASSAIALAFLVRLSTVTARQLWFPYDLVFESPNPTSIELVRAGENPYDPAIYAAPPFLLTMYTPLYHYLVAAHPENPFLTGRWVACISMLTAACALHLLVVDRRQAARLLAWTLGLGLVLALAAQWIWGSGFWFSTIGAVRQQITLDHAGRLAWRIARQPIIPGLLALTAAVSWDALRSQGREALRRSPYLAYVLSSGIVLLLSIGKLGSSTYYVMEFALALRDRIESRIGELRHELEALGYDEPLLLIPNTHRLGPALTARPTLNDPLLYRLLWRDGILDLDDMIASIDAQVYDVIMLPISERLMDPLTPRGLRSAIDRSYEVTRAAAGQRFFVRRARTPDSQPAPTAGLGSTPSP
jgi:hypothetical protein